MRIIAEQMRQLSRILLGSKESAWEVLDGGPTIMATCIECAHFKPARTRPSQGWCHRFPPTLHGEEDDFGWAFPEVTMHDWCGEWKSKQRLTGEMK